MNRSEAATKSASDSVIGNVWQRFPVFASTICRRECESRLHHFERRVPPLVRRDRLLRLPPSVNGRSEQFEEAVAIQGKPVSGEPAAELTVIVDRNLSI